MMHNTARRDAFDSVIFGKNVTKLSLPLSINAAPLSTYDLTLLEDPNTSLVVCHTVAVPENIRFLEARGYALVSTKTRYGLPPHYMVVACNPDAFSIVTEQEYIFDAANPAIKELVTDLAAISHYAKDEHLGTIHHDLYTTWMHNTFHGYAEKVFVALSPLQETMGLLSLRMVHDALFIDLLGVCAAYRQQQVATYLLNHAIGYAKERDKRLFVYTQGENIPANRFYQKNGFLLDTFELVYHKNAL